MRTEQSYYIGREAVESLKRELAAVTAELATMRQYAEVVRQDAERWRHHAQAFAEERDALKEECIKVGAMHSRCLEERDALILTLHTSCGA